MTWSALHDACEHQDTQTVLKRSRSNSEEAVLVDDQGSTPLHIACWSNPPAEVIDALISAHPQAVSDRDLHGDTPMHVALHGPDTNPDVIKQLLKVCPTVASIANKEGLYPLHAACRYCPSNEDVVAILVDAYPFALRKPIKMGNPAPARNPASILVNTEHNHFVSDTSPRTGVSGADLQFRARGVQVRDGAYPLHIAIGSGAPTSVLEILIKESPDVLTMRNKFGDTPLHVALEHAAGNEAIEVLLSTDEGKKATHIAEKRGENLPIHVAALHGCTVDAAKLLLKAHPNSIHAENAEGKNPLEVAMASGNCDEQVVLLLKLSDAAEDV